MASDPYQSNVFRFVLSQYRQGLDRHRQAVRRARSKAALGAALPVYAVVSIYQLAVSKLRQFGRSGRLFGKATEATKLLDFSDVEALLDSADEESLLVVAPETRVAAERWLAQTLTMIGACLDPLQVKILRAAGTTANDLAFGRITGIASDLETRSLVLVRDRTIVWNGLSAAQQAQLQAQMGWFTLARPTRSFWVEVLRVMMWLWQRFRSNARNALPSGLIGLPEAGIGLKLMSTIITEQEKAIQPSLKVSAKAIAVGKKLPVGLVARSPVRSATKSGDNGSSPLYLDADAVTTGYVEHPLEKLLKWVDRLLLWIEVQYRAIKLWLLR